MFVARFAGDVWYTVPAGRAWPGIKETVVIRTLARITRAVLAVAVACTVLTLQTGCNTVKGAGTDIQNAGQAGQNAIDNAGKK